MQGPSTFQTVSSLVIINTSALSGLFVYSTAQPAPNHLIVSISPIQTQDSVGNLVEPYIGLYNDGFSQPAMTISPTAITFYDVVGNTGAVEHQFTEVKDAGGFFYLTARYSATSNILYINENGYILPQQPGQSGVVPEVWHNLTLNAAVWIPFAGAATPRFRLEPIGSGGIVRLDGVVQAVVANPVNTVIATLPVGYRPAAGFKSLATSGPATSYGQLSITTAGVISIGLACPINDGYSLDNITFPVD